MKTKILGALILSVGLCSQTFGAGLLNRMIGGSCCAPTCCDAGNGCCEAGCGAANGGGRADQRSGIGKGDEGLEQIRIDQSHDSSSSQNY